MERRAFWILLTAAVVLGAFLRFEDLDGPSLWLDEILHLHVTRDLADEPWYRHLAGVREIDGETENGPLYYRLQIWGQKLAPGDPGVRLFPALVGTLTVPFMAWAGWLLGGRLVALAAAFLLAVSPLHVYFSREGRPYYLLMALALVLLCALLRGGSGGGRGLAWAGCLAAAYTGLHTVPIVLSFAALAALLWVWSGRGWRVPWPSPWLHYLAAALVAAALSYGLYMTRSQINAPSLDKVQRPSEARHAKVVQTPLESRNPGLFLASMTTSGHGSVSWVGRSWGLLALAILGLAGGLRRRARETVMTAGMFVLPAILSIAALVSVGRGYGMRFTCTSLPAFLLLVALGVGAVADFAKRLRRRPDGAAGKALAWTVAGILLLTLAAPNVEAARTDPYRKLDWRGVARFFDALALDSEPVVVPNLWPQICLEHYLEDLGRDVEFLHVWESAERGAAAVAEHPSGWLLNAGFRRIDDVRSWMRGFVPVLKKPEEGMELFFFPDFVTFHQTRFAAGKGALFEELFAGMGRRFDFAGGESLLQGRGWSYPETDKQGTTFQWALGRQAELALPLRTPRRAELRLRALPFPDPEAPPQRLELWLDDARLAGLELPDKRWSEHRVEVPPSAWSSGANVLYLRFARSARSGGGRAPRDLAAALDYLVLEDRTLEDLVDQP